MKRLAEPELGGPWSAAAANRQVCFGRHVRHLTALRGGSGSRQRLGEARSGVGRLGTVAGTLSFTWRRMRLLLRLRLEISPYQPERMVWQPKPAILRVGRYLALGIRRILGSRPQYTCEIL